MSQRHLFNSYNVSDEMLNTNVQDFTINDSHTLLNSFRIDLIAKHIYIDSKVLNKNIHYSKELYKAHIEAFTHGKYAEQGQEANKNSIQSYYDVFDDLIEKIKEEGFNPKISRVPLDKNGIILDGAHRTAVCSYFHLSLEVSKFDITAPIYDFSFFEKRMIKPKYLDFIVHRYIKIKSKNIYTLCLWPKAYENKESIKPILKENTTIVYEKEISLTPQGAHCFVSQIYSHHEWVGTPKNGFKGTKNKVNACFTKNSPLTLFVIETDKSLNEILEIKEEIRNIFGFGKHSVHITDNFEETKQISELLLNDNTIFHLNNANPYTYYKGVERLLRFKKMLIVNDFKVDEIIIDSSGSMEAFGLRKADDIDFISTQNIPKSELYSKRTEQELFKLYGEDTDYLQSPDSYFYFFGIKFLTLDKVLESKKKRGEKKDLIDITLLEKFIKSNSISKYVDVKFIIKRKRINWKRDFRIMCGKLARKMGIFKIVKIIIDKKNE